MKQPLRRSTRRQVSVGRSIPAPVGGWDAQSPLALMPPENAVILDNWIPRAGYVELRRGFTQWQAGLPVIAETLMSYRSPTNGDDEIFAAAGTSIYDVTSDGGTPSSVYTATVNARWQWINFANDAGTFLIACNGEVAPVYYNGTSFSATAITGTAGVIVLDPTDLVDVMAHKGRLFWLQKDSLRVWFTAPFAIQGASQLLDLGPIFTAGGSILCMGTWTIDGGSGADDLAVFVTTKGQVAIYQGINPADADDWALVGVYDIGFPMSRRSLIKYGSDLVLVTSDGAVPLSQALQLDRAQENLVAITAKIQPEFQKSSQAYRNNFGWEATLYPRGSLAIINIPVEELTTSLQYVQNIQTGAWCRFKNMNATSWVVANDRAYFAAGTGVFLWDEGYEDNGEDIVADLKTAFNYFSSRGSLKKFEMLQPILRIQSSLRPAIEVLTDFKEKTPTAIPTVPVEGDGMEIETRDTWTSATGIGYCGAVRMRVGDVPPTFGDLAVGDGSLVSSDGDDVILAEANRLNSIVEVIAFNLKFQNQTGGQL